MTDRTQVLEQGPVTIGHAWARAVCDSIEGEGRIIAGGWPGTLVEARARIASHLRDQLSERSMKALDPEELAEAVNATYANAKKGWLEAERVSRRLKRPHASVDD